MPPSLCVVLPVRNVEATLASVVANVLDAADQTGAGFEVLIVDNGSQDDTWDVVCDLSRRFPQVSAIRSPNPIGLGQIIESAQNRTQAGQICVHRGVGVIMADEIVRLWHAHVTGCVDRPEHDRPGAPFGFQLLPHVSSASTPKFASRIALIEHVARKETSRQLRRQMLCHAAVSDLNLAK